MQKIFLIIGLYSYGWWWYVEIKKYLEENNIFVRDYGHVKGMENYLRITIGTQEQMKKILNIMKRFNIGN